MLSPASIAQDRFAESINYLQVSRRGVIGRIPDDGDAGEPANYRNRDPHGKQ
jgi:hypothetical protein